MAKTYEFVDHTMTWSWWAPAAPACAPRWAWPNRACAPPASPRCSRPARTPSRRRAASPRRWQHGAGHWQWHMYDTVKGSDWLGDTDAMEYLAREAPKAVYELEHYGVPFSRTEEGKIYQRPFGGHTTEFGEGPPVQRTCAAADRTGHAILHTLYGQSLKNNAEFYIEYFAIDLMMSEDGRAPASWPGSSTTARSTVFNAKMVVLATGGYGRAYFSPPPRIPAPATAAAWSRARACRCRTWNSCSSTPPASTARAA
jgi:hypothetical protein